MWTNRPRPRAGTLYRRADADAAAVRRLVANLADGMVEDHLAHQRERDRRAPIVSEPPAGRPARMKAVMYHYVRHHDGAAPYQRYLHVDAFERQLDELGSRWGFVDRSSFDRAIRQGRATDGVVLTFDDGLRDHAEVVLPILERRGLWGIFYIPTAPYRTGRMLAVHRVHHLIGTYGGRRRARGAAGGGR